MTKSRRPPHTNKAPKKGVESIDIDETRPLPLAGTNTIPVQAEWLEGEDAPRPSPRSRLQKGPPPLPPLPPLPPIVADYFDDAQRALQRLQALHPARDNERLLGELESKLRRPIDAGQAKVTTRHGHVVIKIAIDTLFAAGEANVKPAGARALAQIAAALPATGGERLQVEGHSSGARLADWALCASRAMAVAKGLAAGGVARSTVSVAAFGVLSQRRRSASESQSPSCAEKRPPRCLWKTAEQGLLFRGWTVDPLG